MAIAGIIAAGGIFALDNSPAGNQRITNAIYCNDSHILFGFDRDEIINVAIGIYFGNEVPSGEVKESIDSFEIARGRYLLEFGINLVPAYRGNVEIPEFTESDTLAGMITDIDDFELVFTHKAHFEGNIIDADYNLVAMIVRVNPHYGIKCASEMLVHEIAHMFYAGHSEKPSSIMFTEVFCSGTQGFDSDTRETMEVYKKRIW